MKFKDKLLLSGGLLSVALMGFGLSAATFAAPNDVSEFTPEQHQEFRGQRDAVREAIKNNDYQAWVEAMNLLPKEPPFEINEENFNKLVEAHEHLQAAHAIFEELGIKRPGKGHGPRQGGQPQNQ